MTSKEFAEFAQRALVDACRKQGITPHDLVWAFSEALAKKPVPARQRGEELFEYLNTLKKANRSMRTSKIDGVRLSADDYEILCEKLGVPGGIELRVFGIWIYPK